MDGWIEKPCGWNKFELSKYKNDIINVDLEKYDHQYVMVLAGGLDNCGRNHPWVKDRLDVAYKLYKNKRRKIIILGGGTYHKSPYINQEGYVIHESTMGAKYLKEMGVKEEDLYREWASYDTIANGYFSLINFVIPLEIKNVLVITSDFHMIRSKLIFDWIYGLWDKSIKVDFLEVSTKYLDREIIEIRKDREIRSAENLREMIEGIHDLVGFHRWFYVNHQAYNCNFNNKREILSEDIKRSY